MQEGQGRRFRRASRRLPAVSGRHDRHAQSPDLTPNAKRMKAARAGAAGYATATDLADWLVRALKMPFRDAHHVTGRIVAKRITDEAFGVLERRSASDSQEPHRILAEQRRPRRAAAGEGVAPSGSGSRDAEFARFL